LSLLSIPGAYALDLLTLPHLYAVALVNGSLTVFLTLAYQAYLPELVERRHLVEANAKFEATETVARLAGPGAGGGLVALLTAPVAVLADALSFLVSGALIFSMERDEGPASRAADAGTERAAFWSELREGGRFALRNVYARALLAATATLNIGFAIAWAILLVFVVRELDIGAGLAGVVLSAGEVGGLLGALVTTRLMRWLGIGASIIGSAALFGLGFGLIALAPPGMALPFLVCGWALVSFASVVYNSTTVSLRQAYVPQRLQGRVVGFNRAIVWGVSPLGAVLGGGLATVLGLRSTMIAGGVICLLALLPAVFSPVRSLRDLPEPLEPDRTPARHPESPTLTAAGR
jgi:Na+/melibiose symporter-like transporter